MAEIVWESDAQMSGFTIMSNGMVWPDDWPGTLVEAQFTSARGDSADLDRDPDMVPSGPGLVTFTPLVRTVGYDGEHGKRIVSLHPFEAVVGDDGYLYTPDEYGQPGIRGIVLPSNNSDVVDEHDWTWRVTFDIPDTTIRPTHIPTPHDHSVDIKDYLDSDANHGVRVVVDRVSARETLAARDETLAARDLVLPARDQTLAARDETLQHGITVDTSVGTRVFVGNTMIYGDTGWRNVEDILTDDWGLWGNPESPSNFSYFRIRRENSNIFLEARLSSQDSLEGVNRAIPVNITDGLPNGFLVRNSAVTVGELVAYADGTRLIIRNNSGTLESRFGQGQWQGVSSGSPGSLALASARWSTSDPWPTTLPGTPA